MKRVLFIDRDGTLIVEPEDTEQVDSLERLEFMPGVFRYLQRIAGEFDYDLVMVSNQDGLGTPAYPEESFRLVQDKMLEAFGNEGVRFARIFIDRSRPEDNNPNRKPGTGMLREYLEGDFDLAGSFVIGDRVTDMELARNLGARGILYGGRARSGKLNAAIKRVTACETKDWAGVYDYLLRENRKSVRHRVTNETDVSVELVLEGSGQYSVATGLGFFDHMLEQVARHSGCDLVVKASGDLHVDEHHTVEDVAIVLGEAFDNALGDRRGIERYGFVLPMDESLARASVDLGGRSWLEWDVTFRREKIGDVPTELFEHFFRSFATAARCSLHLSATGKNEHHIAEAVFKSFARALRAAIRRDPGATMLPSTKGKI